MAEIPAGSKFMIIDPSVPTKELKSARSNSKTEVYTIEDIKETVGGGSEYAETIVNISSAQILNWGSNRIEILADLLNPNTYYDAYGVVEYDAGEVDTFTLGSLFIGNWDGSNPTSGTLISNDLVFSGVVKSRCFFNLTTAWKNNGANTPALYTNINSGVYIGGFSISGGGAQDPTQEGDSDSTGTLRVKIYHKTITFGA